MIDALLAQAAVLGAGTGFVGTLHLLNGGTLDWFGVWLTFGGWAVAAGATRLLDVRHPR